MQRHQRPLRYPPDRADVWAVCGAAIWQSVAMPVNTGRPTSRWRLPRGDEGSILPLILVFVLIVVLMLMGMMASTSAFIGQRDLQSDCDSAAVAVSQAVSAEAWMALEESPNVVPLDATAVQNELDAFRTMAFPDDETLTMVGVADTFQVTVQCRRVVDIPFGRVFGYGDGLERTTESTARSPIR